MPTTMKFDLSKKENQSFVIVLLVLSVGFILVAFGHDGEIKALMGASLGYFFGSTVIKRR